MKRRGFTLIELLIVLAIIAILGSIMIGAVGGCNRYKQTQTGTYRCIKAYTVTTGTEDSTSTSKRIDLKPVNGGPTETFNCDDSFMAGVHNSATRYAQFEPGKYYEVVSAGYRQEGWISYFPLVTSVHEVDDPKKLER